MKSIAVTVLLAGGFLGTVGLAQAPTAGDSTIDIISQGERGADPGASTKFTGHAQVEQLCGARGASQVTGGVVVFQPGARSNWHTHPVGQILIVTAGTGLVQQWRGPVQTMRAGDVVWIPAGVKHWHGATPANSVTHIAIQQGIDGKVVDWLEPVTDQQYLAHVANAP